MNIFLKVIIVIVFISCKTKNVVTLKNKQLKLDKVVWLEGNYANFYCSYKDLIEEINYCSSLVKRINKAKLDSSLKVIELMDSVNILNELSSEFIDVINYSYIHLTEKSKTKIYYTNDSLLVKKIIFEEELINDRDTPYYSVLMKDTKGTLLLQAYHKSFGCHGNMNPRFK